MHDRLEAKTPCCMNITKLEVLQGLIANNDTSKPQLIHIKALTDLRKSHTTLKWYSAGDADYFASATVEYGNNDIWLADWDRIAHLVSSRIESLEQMERDGSASKLSRNMAYRLFANLVDYSEKYRGIQSVIISGLEAVADVKLAEHSSGSWTIPPYFIDSVCHLAGLIMNGGDASETREHFYVTPGWDSMRFTCSFVPGGRYRSYVKMRPTQPGFWAGDLYILQGDVIVGMVGGIIFRRFPRTLLGRLFSPPDKKKRTTAQPSMDRSVAVPIKTETHPSTEMVVVQPGESSRSQPRDSHHLNTPPPTGSSFDDNPIFFTRSASNALTTSTTGTSIITPPQDATIANGSSSDYARVDRALAIIAREAAIDDIAELSDDASFVNLGIDSLLSLVLAERFREELDIILSGAQFLECPTVGDFKAWFKEHF